MRLHLRVISGLQSGEKTRIDPPGGVVGRTQDCALHLRDDSVSRCHLELRFAQDGWWAYQHSARSPTLVDGIPVGSTPQLLREQGVLQVGSIAVEYRDERTAQTFAAAESPPTMINVRRQLSTIQQAVLPQMTPMRVAEPELGEAPATLIMRRPPPPAAAAPPTMIQRPGANLSAPVMPAAPAAAPAYSEETADLLVRLEHAEKERDALRRERDELAAQLQTLDQEHAALKTAPSASVAPTASAAPAARALSEQALRFLRPFAESIEQATDSLAQGNSALDRTLLRDASFQLADLRDLFESSSHS